MNYMIHLNKRIIVSGFMPEATVIFTLCESCGEETPHRVLRGKMGATPESGFEGTVQCVTCKTIHSAHIPMEKPVSIHSVISNGELSERKNIEFGPLEEVRVGEEFFWEDHNLQITSIEIGGKRVNISKAREISGLWLKIFDTVSVKVSIVRGPNTKSEKVEAAPDEEFAVGDMLEFGKDKVVIDKIKTTRRMVYREGSTIEAREITRVYAKLIKERTY